MLRYGLAYIERCSSLISGSGLTPLSEHHTEVWFICKEDKTRELAVAIVRAHCATWALLNHNLGIPDLPVQRLIYDLKIDITKCLRKEHDQVINTPDFKYDQKGYYYQVNKETGKLEKYE